MNCSKLALIMTVCVLSLLACLWSSYYIYIRVTTSTDENHAYLKNEIYQSSAELIKRLDQQSFQSLRFQSAVITNSHGFVLSAIRLSPNGTISGDDQMVEVLYLNPSNGFFVIRGRGEAR